MSSQHQHPTRVYRAPDGEYDPAKATADAAGYNANVIVRAFLRWLNEDPTRLSLLESHLKAVADEIPKGRPRRAVDG